MMFEMILSMLLQENKELREALEEQQNVMELIMSKYREQVAKLLTSGPDLHAADNTAMQRKVSSRGLVSHIFEFHVCCFVWMSLKCSRSFRHKGICARLLIKSKLDKWINCFLV